MGVLSVTGVLAMPSAQQQNYKIVLLGEGKHPHHPHPLTPPHLYVAGCVGKSSIVLRYVEDKFNSSHLSTLQVCTRHNLQLFPGVRPALGTM